MSSDRICECQCRDKTILQLKLYFTQEKNFWKKLINKRGSLW